MTGANHAPMVAHFLEAAAQCGLIIKNPIADGRLHRCDVEGKGKSGKGDGAYVLDLDGDIPHGGFQNWRDGAGWRNWHARTGQKRTAAEVAAYKERVRAIRAEREAETARQQADTAAQARAIIKELPEAPQDHPYLVAKGIDPHGVLYSKEPIAISPWRKSKPNALVIPMQDVDGTIWSLQIIDAGGIKDFLYGGRKKGCLYVIRKCGAVVTGADINPDGLNLIGEGFATGVSLFKAEDAPTIVAFDAGNLEAVARALRERHSKAKFIICGDDDWKTVDKNGNPTNPGRIHAERAARAIRAEVAFPVWPPGRYRDDKWTDFNDLHKSEGPGEVRLCVERAEPPDRRPEREERPANPDVVDQIEAAITRLAALSETAYQAVRKDEAKALKVDVRFLDRRVKVSREANLIAVSTLAATRGTKPKVISTIEPWPEAVDGEVLLEELTATFKRHVVMTDEEALAAALWDLHAHVHNAAVISPILMIRSAEKRCGKTTVMKILKWVTPKALMASNLTASSIFRVIDQWHPTLIVDEADTFLRSSEELMGVLNSGHDREGAYVMRTVETSKGFDIREFSTWAPKAIALIGAPPDTLDDRSITIKLGRKLRRYWL